jgi:hypothetical protein
MLAITLLVTVAEVASGQFTFRQRNNTEAVARFGFGNTRFRGGFTADQGSSISTSMAAPTVTMPANGSASFFSGRLRPFVTGFTPVVGAGGYYPTPWQRRVNNVGQRPWSTAINQVDRQTQRDDARADRRLRIIEKYQQRAEHEERMGRTGAARMYYRMALKRAAGEHRELIVAKLEELE